MSGFGGHARTVVDDFVTARDAIAASFRAAVGNRRGMAVSREPATDRSCVYVLTACYGYEDVHVVGVFTTPEAAGKMREAIWLKHRCEFVLEKMSLDHASLGDDVAYEEWTYDESGFMRMVIR